jgi:hypothetical protein
LKKLLAKDSRAMLAKSRARFTAMNRVATLPRANKVRLEKYLDLFDLEKADFESFKSKASKKPSSLH